jgi:hypothetical protein
MLLDDGGFLFGGISPDLENSLSQTFNDMHDDEGCCGVAPKPCESRNSVFAGGNIFD